MFDIRFESETENIACITLGDFKESFEVSANIEPNTLIAMWKTALNESLNDKAVVLPVWVTNSHIARGWVLYPDGDSIHIQDMLFVTPPLPSLNMPTMPPRATTTEDGHRISEWSIKLEEVKEFLERSAAI